MSEEQLKVGDEVIRKKHQKHSNPESGIILGIRKLADNEYARVKWPYSSREIRLDALTKRVSL